LVLLHQGKRTKKKCLLFLQIIIAVYLAFIFMLSPGSFSYPDRWILYVKFLSEMAGNMVYIIFKSTLPDTRKSKNKAIDGGNTIA